MAQLILWGSLSITTSAVRLCATHTLASWLRQHGYTVKVIDFCDKMSKEDVVRITERYIGPETVAIGVSTTFWRNMLTPGIYSLEPAWVSYARGEIEAAHPTLKWLLGGARVVSTSNTAIENNASKWVIFKGEGEDKLLKWMDNQTGTFKQRGLFDIKSQQVGFMEDDFIQSYETLPLEMGRGCQFTCKFCNFPGVGKKKGTYIRSMECVKAEILENYEKWGTTNYFIQDDTMNEDAEKVRMFAEFVQSLPFRLNWVGYIRVDLISSYGQAQTLKDAGLRSAFFGIESFHPIAAKEIGKGWNAKNGKAFLKQLRDVEWKDDTTMFLSMIAGLPGEPLQSIIDNDQWIIDNQIQGWMYTPLLIYPRSEIDRDENGVPYLRPSEFDLNYEKYGYTFPYEHDNRMWHSPLTTRAEAAHLVVKLNEAQRKFHGKPAAWDAAGIVSNNAMTWEQCATTKLKDVDYNYVHACRDDHVSRYVDFQLNRAVPY